MECKDKLFEYRIDYVNVMPYNRLRNSTYGRLKSLGAETTDSFGDHLAYYITSVPSVKTSFSIQKRLLAAELLGIPVVSLAWVDKCKETGSRADMEPFIVKGLLRAVSLDTQCICCTHEARSRMTAAAEADNGTVSISTADSEADIAPISSANNLTALPASPPSPRPQQPVLARRPSSTASLAAVSGLPRAHSVDSVPQAAVIMLPTFREISPPVVPAEVLEKVQKRRRSERICDLLEEDSDDELFSAAKRGKGSAEQESWEAISRISVLQPLPVFYEPGEEGDVLQITPEVLNGGRCSGGAGSSSSSSRRAASGVKGLTVKGKRDHRSAASTGRAGKTSHGGGNSTSGSGSKATASTDRHGKTGKTALKATLSEAPPAASEVSKIAAPTAPKTTVVIAMTGYDDKSGDRAALVQTLRLFIKRDKRPVSAEAVAEAPTELEAATASAPVTSGVSAGSLGALGTEAAAAAPAQGVEDDTVCPENAALVVDDSTERGDAVDEETGAGPIGEGGTGTGTGTGAGVAEVALASNNAPGSSVNGAVIEVQQPTPEPPARSAVGPEHGTLEGADSTVAAPATAAVEVGSSAALECPAPAASEPAPLAVADTTPAKRGRGRPPGSTKKHSAGSSSGSSSSSKISSGTSTRGAARSIHSSSGANTGNDSISQNGSCSAGVEGPGLVYNSRWRVDPLEASVSLTFEHNDFSAASCTHVVVSAKLKQPRTLRTLFALARGQCILTEEWVHESVRRGAWADVGPFLHPRFPQQLEAGTAEGVFRGQKICVLDSVNPPTEVLIDLVRAAGGQVATTPGEPGVDFVVFGDVCAANDWIETKRKRHKSDSHKEVADARALARENKAVSCQFLFHCIEEGRVRAPRLELDELVTIEHLLVFACSDKNYEDAVQAVAKAGARQPLSYDAAAKEVNRARAAQREANPSREYWVPSVARPDSDKSGKADRHRAVAVGSSKHHSAGASSSSGGSGRTSARVKQEPQTARLREESVMSVRTSARRSAAQAGTGALTEDPVADSTATGQSTDPVGEQLVAGHRVVSEPHLSSLGTTRGTSRRSTGGEDRQVAVSALPVKAERRTPRPPKTVVLNKHALRDGKGKFKPLRQLRAEAAARAAGQIVPQAEVEVGEGRDAAMEVVEGQDGTGAGEGDGVSGEAAFVAELASESEQGRGQGHAVGGVGAYDAHDSSRDPEQVQAESTAQDTAAGATHLMAEDDNHSTSDHSFSSPGPDHLSEENAREDEGEGEGEGGEDIAPMEMCEGDAMAFLSLRTIPAAAPCEETSTFSEQPASDCEVSQRELTQGPVLASAERLSEQALQISSAELLLGAPQDGVARAHSRAVPSPKKRKYGFVDTLASADLQGSMVYQCHLTSISASAGVCAGVSAGAGAERSRGATPTPAPVLSNYLAAVTEESPELSDGGMGAGPDLQLGAFARPLPASQLLLRAEEAGRVIRTVSDASCAVAQDSYRAPMPMEMGVLPLPAYLGELAAKPSRSHAEDFAAPALAGGEGEGEGQLTSQLQWQQQQP